MSNQVDDAFTSVDADGNEHTWRRAPQRPTPKRGHPEFYRFIDSLYKLHEVKSGGYGDNDDPFANFTAVAAVSGRHRFEYPIERMIEKLTRCKSLIAQGRLSAEDLGEEFGDIAGLAGCCEAMRREDVDGSSAAEHTEEELEDIRVSLDSILEPGAGLPVNFLRLHGETDEQMIARRGHVSDL